MEMLRAEMISSLKGLIILYIFINQAAKWGGGMKTKLKTLNPQLQLVQIECSLLLDSELHSSCSGH